MKVTAFNGSPRPAGNTYQALRVVTEQLQAEGIETEIVQAGAVATRGCAACGQCGDGVCALGDDAFHQLARKLYEADGVLLGSPVYYAGMAGGFKSFLDRAFFVSRGRMRMKLGASVAVCRRTGGMPAFDQMNAYFLISEMPIVSSFYWNVAHGGDPGEILADTEALSVLKNLGRNLAWLLRAKAAAGPPPPPVERAWMNFIR
jgi:multimeric flavodoxin WrbA